MSNAAKDEFCFVCGVRPRREVNFPGQCSDEYDEALLKSGTVVAVSETTLPQLAELFEGAGLHIDVPERKPN